VHVSWFSMQRVSSAILNALPPPPRSQTLMSLLHVPWLSIQISSSAIERTTPTTTTMKLLHVLWLSSQIVSSAIVNAPPPQTFMNLLHKTSSDDGTGAYSGIVSADSVISHCECNTTTDRHEPAANTDRHEPAANTDRHEPAAKTCSGDRTGAYTGIVCADSIISHSECTAPTDLHEPVAQDQPVGCGDEAPDQGEDGAHLQRPPHWRQAACSEVGQQPLRCSCLHSSADLQLLALVCSFALFALICSSAAALLLSAVLQLPCSCLQLCSCPALVCRSAAALLLSAGLQLPCPYLQFCSCPALVCRFAAALLLSAVLHFLHLSAVLQLPCSCVQFCSCPALVCSVAGSKSGQRLNGIQILSAPGCRFRRLPL